MAEDTTNLVLEWMRRLDRKYDALAEDMKQMGFRVNASEHIQSGLIVSEYGQNSVIDRLKMRVERIEKRLELHDPAEREIGRVEPFARPEIR